MNDNTILEHYGWTIECESPFEIRHEDGSFASGQAAYTVLIDLVEDYECEVIKKPIELTFGPDNHFDPVAIKHNNKGERIDFAKTVRWFINNAENSIENSYDEGAPRRVEMYQLCNSLRNQLKAQLSKEQIREIKL